MKNKQIHLTALGFGNNMRAQKAINQLYMQRKCDKHEYVMVTQTTTKTVDGKTESVDKKEWMQCKNCGRSIMNEQRLEA